jgi:hypothetical protein
MLEDNIHQTGPLSLEDRQNSLRAGMEEITEDQNEKGEPNKVKDYKNNIIKSVRKSTKSGKGKM